MIGEADPVKNTGGPFNQLPLPVGYLVGPRLALRRQFNHARPRPMQPAPPSPRNSLNVHVSFLLPFLLFEYAYHRALLVADFPPNGLFNFLEDLLL